MLASILGTAQLLRERKVSPVELTQDCLARIDKLNGTLHAFITVTADSALVQARTAEAEIARGNWRGPLHGIPLALKDLIDTAGIPTTAASALFRHRIPDDDAEVVRRLKNDGAVLLGKQNLHECAYGGSSVISYFGEVHNPWDQTRIAGGSSGGSAAAVAADLCYGSIGTDTAGSVRQPAAFCGIVGLKPTYGRASARGVIPLSESLDHIGPITRTVADSAAILSVIAGHDPKDKNSSATPVSDYLAVFAQKPKSARLGVPRKFFYEDLDPEVASATEQALSILETMGHQLREIELSAPTDRTLGTAEAYAFHAPFIAQHPELYHPETLRRIRQGEDISTEQLETHRQELARVRRETPSVFRDVDFLITPTTPVPAPPIGELLADLDQLRPREIVLLRNTRPVNFWGLPAISVPCGFTRAGVPIGLQIIGPPWEEGRVLQFAYAYEQATDWHKRRPALG